MIDIFKYSFKSFSLINIFLFIYTSISYQRINIYSLIFTLSCSFRLYYPQNTIYKITLNESKYSNVFNDRLIANIGEMSFVLQLINYYNLSFNFFYLITIAQIICWFSILFNLPFFHSVENLLWTFLVYNIHIIENGYIKIFTSLYISYIFILDIPLYYNTKNRISNPIKEFYLIKKQSKYCDNFNIWLKNSLWMYGYFVGSCWFSIYLIY
jgi:hypothetical protein